MVKKAFAYLGKLSEILKGRFDYIYMGEELGGYRQGGYKNFTITSKFQLGLHKLEKQGRNWLPRKHQRIATS